MDTFQDLYIPFLRDDYIRRGYINRCNEIRNVYESLKCNSMECCECLYSSHNFKMYNIWMDWRKRKESKSIK